MSLDVKTSSNSVERPDGKTIEKSLSNIDPFIKGKNDVVYQAVGEVAHVNIHAGNIKEFASDFKIFCGHTVITPNGTNYASISIPSELENVSMWLAQNTNGMASTQSVASTTLSVGNLTVYFQDIIKANAQIGYVLFYK